MKYLFITVLLILPILVLSQGKNISLSKKILAPYVTIANDTLRIDQQLTIATGSNPDGSFKYVQLLNGFNEPIEPATSRFAMKKQEIKFFKEQDGTTYAFTKFFVINIEAALLAKEVRLNQ